LNSIWPEVSSRLAEHEYMVGVSRSADRIKATGEIFTPTELVVDILKYTDLNLFAPGKTVLDPACGDGQFLVAVKWIKVLHHQMDEHQAILDIYGVDIMRDNVDCCLLRLGGGTILMGDSLNPTRRLEMQTEAEHKLMLELFAVEKGGLMKLRKSKTNYDQFDRLF
jgi:2-polyprenyl-3-methyl-5-hydroxy-6-metoxy-1,4-benzoquinol methylase